jgi:hypothetical protein
MGLRNCYECGNAVSDRASACPKCGAPQASAVASPTSGPQAPTRRRTHPLAWMALAGIIGYFSYAAYQANLPKIPVAVKYRPALTQPGLVLMFENTSDSALTFVATLTRPATSNTRSLELLAGAHQTVSISSRDGWLGEHGDQVTLKNNHFQTWSGSIP